MATDEKNDGSLHIGQKFSTYEEFEKILAQRSKLFSEKWHLDSGGRTIKRANAKISNPSLHYKEEFRYAFVNLKCIHGGHFKSKGTKRNRKSLLLDCPAKITLSARRKEDCMVVTKLHLEHNHELIPESCGYYHADRKPTEEQREEITKLVRLGLPARKIMKHMSDTTGKVFRRYDIHNVSRKIKRPQEAVEQEVSTVLTKMCQDDCTSQYFVREDVEKNVSTIFLQTGAMLRILREYSDVIYIDGTFCLSNLGYSLYVFMCVDSENKSHVVCYGIVKDMTNTTISDVFNEFISNNDIQVKTVFVDKDAAGMAAIKEAMPEANVLLCRFHVAQAFKAATTKYCSVPERKKSRDILMTMLDCSSEEDFKTAYNMLPGRLKSYVEKNWMSNKEIWAQHATKYALSWGSEMANHFERHKKVLKSLSLNTQSLPPLVEKILTYHRSEERRLAFTAADAILKTRVHHSSIPSNHLENCSFLSHVACDLVVGQMEKLFLSPDLSVVVDGEIVHVEKDETETEMNVVISGDECSCLFYLKYRLPCWHLMACCLVNERPLVNKESVPRRWLKATLLAAFTEQVVSEDTSASVVASVSQEKNGTDLNDVQKREEASRLWNDLVSAMVSCGQESFDIRCEVLRSLIKSWNDGRDIPPGMILGKDEKDGERLQTIIIQGQTDYGMEESAGDEIKLEEVNSYVVQIADIGEPISGDVAASSSVSNDLLNGDGDPNSPVVSLLQGNYDNVNVKVEVKDCPAGLDVTQNAVIATVTDHSYLAPQKIVISNPKSST